MKYSIKDTVRMTAAHTNLPMDTVEVVIRAYGATLARMVSISGPTMRVPIPWLGILEVWQRPDGQCALANIGYKYKIRKKVRLIPHRNIRGMIRRVYGATPEINPLGDLIVTDTGDDPNTPT